MTLLVGGGTVLIVAAKQAGFDTLAAPIALAAVIIGALIACGFTIYQLRYNARLEEENLRLKDQIAAVRAAQERERKQREMEEAAALSALREAQRIENWAQAYRQALRHDPHISQLKILSMQRPLELVSVYVPLRLHQQARPDTMDEDLLAAEASREPNAVLRASRMRLESRTSAALDPDQAIRTYKHCVIVGDPGAGKTTLFKNLTLKSAAQGLSGLPDLPIYIELNKFVNSDQQNLLDFASTKWDEYGFPKT